MELQAKVRHLKAQLEISGNHVITTKRFLYGPR